MNEAQMVEALMEFIREQNGDKDCGGKCKCSCGVTDVFEQSVARFSERASNVAAAQMESFALQTNASNAAIVNMTSRITNPS